MSERYFFVLHGGNETIPRAEVLATLEAENVPFEDPRYLDQVLSVKTNNSAPHVVGLRASMTHYCCRHIFSCVADTNIIMQKAKRTNFEDFIKGESFAVRVKRIKKKLSVKSMKMKTEKLEREIGSLIKQNTSKKVDLKSPCTKFLGVLTERTFIFGTIESTIPKKKFQERNGCFLPYFHPGIMKPQTSRLMVNLARAKRNNPSLKLLDPFCGIGGILIEGGLIGCNLLGFDIDRSMIKGCRENLKCFELNAELMVADARKLPFNNEKIDAVATDPPYARSTSTKGEEVPELIKKFFYEVASVLKVGGHVCIAVPDYVSLENIAERAGLKIMELHKMYVHGSLTRLIGVLKK